MEIAGYKTHWAADLFPMLSGEELKALVEDIREHGLQSPIVLDREKRIIDGRNRFAACVEAGVLPRFTTFEGGVTDIVRFVRSANVVRRHLSASQVAMLVPKLGAEMKTELEREAEARRAATQISGGRAAKSSNDGGGNRATKLKRAPKTRDQLAAAFDVSARYIQDAEAIAKEPELAAQVEAGQLSIPQAKRQLKAKKGGKKANGKPRRPTASTKAKDPDAIPPRKPPVVVELDTRTCGEWDVSDALKDIVNASIARLDKDALESIYVLLRMLAERIDAHVHPSARPDADDPSHRGTA